MSEVLYSLQLKPKDVLEKYNEEIDGEKQTSFALGWLTSCFVPVVRMSVRMFSAVNFAIA